jgi:hypothetical protein
MGFRIRGDVGIDPECNATFEGPGVSHFSIRLLDAARICRQLATALAIHQVPNLAVRS